VIQARPLRRLLKSPTQLIPLTLNAGATNEARAPNRILIRTENVRPAPLPLTVAPGRAAAGAAARKEEAKSGSVQACDSETLGFDERERRSQEATRL
jgi:hypothetical protein